MRIVRSLLMLPLLMIAVSFIGGEKVAAAEVCTGPTLVASSGNTSRTYRFGLAESGSKPAGTMTTNKSCPLTAPPIAGMTVTSARLASLNNTSCIPVEFAATGSSGTSQGTNFSRYVRDCGSASTYALFDDAAVVTVGGRIICMARNNSNCPTDGRDYNASSSATDAGAVRSMGFIDGYMNNAPGTYGNPVVGDTLVMSGGIVSANFEVKQQYTGGFYADIAIRFDYSPVVTMQGRVFRHPSEISGGGIGGITLSTCVGNVTTNAAGYYSFVVTQGTPCDINVVGSPAPTGTTGGPRVRPWSEGYGEGTAAVNCPAFGASTSTPTKSGNNYCPNPGYDWQIAGQDAHTNCGIIDFCGMDRASDTGFDIIYRDIPNPTISSFNVTCGGGVTFNASAPSGNWNARLYVDGVSTGTGSLGRIPNSGNRSNSVPGGLAITPWHDVRAHSFYVVVYDASSGASTTSAPIDPGACLNLACGPISFSPSAPQPNEDFNMRFNLAFRENFGSNDTVNQVGSVYESGFGYTVGYNATGFVPPSGSRAGGNISTYITEFGPIRVLTGGNYNGVINVTVPGGPSLSGGSGCTFAISAASRPYFQAFSGDIKSCGIGATAGEIKAFNNGAAAGYTGAGAQLGVKARSAITEFVSASLRTTGATMPKGLTFANIGSGDAGSTYGGGLGGATCIESYWNPAATMSSNSNAGETIPIGTRVTRYVNGNLTITGNIDYATGSWTRNNTPYVRYVVNGNIFISPGVTVLSGDYIATGTIYSCAAGAVPDAVYVRDNCNTRLTVYGSFIAPNVRLLRMYGSVVYSVLGDNVSQMSANNNKAAEVFVQSPENWFSEPGGSSSSTNAPYDSITSLPPVL